MSFAQPIHPPAAGVALVYWPELAPLFGADRGLVDLVEVEPQLFWRRGSNGALEQDRRALSAVAALPQPKLVHSAFAPVGGTRVDEGHLAALATSVEALNPLWVSEHCSFNRAAIEGFEVYTSFLLPPPQTPAGIAVTASNLRRLSDRLGLPVAFETGVNYLRPRSGELPDGAFWRAVAEAADCGILLDLHNLWANARNGRDLVERVLEELPLERVIEVHMAGGAGRDGYWLDAHSGPSSNHLKGLLVDLMPSLPNLRALTFEIMPDHVRRLGLDVVAAELEALRRIWEERPAGTGVGCPQGGRAAPSAHGRAIEEVADRETILAAQVLRRTPLTDDPGLALLAAEIEDFRAGAAARNLTLTLRLMHLNLGFEAVRTRLQAFWKLRPPEVFPSAEALALATFLAPEGQVDPGLGSLLALECAVIRAQCDGLDDVVAFPFAPEPFLADLQAGVTPRRTSPGSYAVEVVAADWR